MFLVLIILNSAYLRILCRLCLRREDEGLLAPAEEAWQAEPSNMALGRARAYSRRS